MNYLASFWSCGRSLFTAVIKSKRRRGRDYSSRSLGVKQSSAGERRYDAQREVRTSMERTNDAGRLRGGGVRYVKIHPSRITSCDSRWSYSSGRFAASGGSFP